MTRALVAITGASGGIYGVALVHRLLAGGVDVDVVMSPTSKLVLKLEHDLTGDPLGYLTDDEGRAPTMLDVGNLAARPASGSSAPDAMIVCPCSMGTAARIATGTSETLIGRAADVMMKERRPLVIVPREAPMSTLHLRTLTTLSELGVHVVPAMPAFYTRPTSIDDMIAFVVDRAIQSAGLDVPLRHPWTGVPDGDA